MCADTLSQSALRTVRAVLISVLALKIPYLLTRGNHLCQSRNGRADACPTFALRCAIGALVKKANPLKAQNAVSETLERAYCSIFLAQLVQGIGGQYVHSSNALFLGLPNFAFGSNICIMWDRTCHSCERQCNICYVVLVVASIQANNMF